MKLKVKKLYPFADVPRYAKPGDAGLDLTAASLSLNNGRYVYGTGLAVEIPEGYVGLIFPRSSICNYDLRLTNCVGVIDSGYRGEIKFSFESDGMHGRGEFEGCFVQHKIYAIGDRIGQLIVMPFPQVEVELVEALSDSTRGTGGFGSSGK